MVEIEKAFLCGIYNIHTSHKASFEFGEESEGAGFCAAHTFLWGLPLFSAAYHKRRK
jgi:hypothetical protein